MKVTKKLEKEILQAYDAYLLGYINGDVRTFKEVLDEDLRMIGSTETEIFFKKKDALDFYIATSDQVAGKIQLRNRKIDLAPAGDLILVTEQSDFYILIGAEWNFYAKARLSTLFQKKDAGWKIIQQHGSMPDTRAIEGEQFAMEKVARENIDLRDAIRRRTVELEHKNRELEIETALEKVRVVAMGMKEPADMPDVCEHISLQLQSLGVEEIRNVQTAIFYESRGTYWNYEYYSKHHKKVITETSYTNHKIPRAFAAKMIRGKGEFFVTHLKGKKVKDWYTYQKTTNVFIDHFLEKASSLNYYWHSLGPVALGISSYKPLSTEDLGLFKRFLNVFELAYTRYLDIEQAEGQAREAQIQLALERVRSRTMAMHKSEEVMEVAGTLFQELKKLGFDFGASSIIIIDKKSGDAEYWIAGFSKEKFPESYKIRYFPHPYHDALLSAWKAGKESFIFNLAGEEKKVYDEVLFNQTDYKNIPQKEQKLMRGIESAVFTLAFMKHGAIHWGPLPLNEEQQDVLQRFAKVFEQSYTRFLDLQKAEAQVREAKIEMALERVRSRSLAMHSSGELGEVITVVLNNLLELGYIIDRGGAAHLAIFSEGTKDFFQWSADPSLPHPVRSFIPYTDLPILSDFWDARQKGHDFFARGYSLDEKNTWFNYAFEHSDLKHIPGELKKLLLESETYAHSIAMEKNSAIMINSITGNQLSENQIDILRRFSKVFEQAYIRFLDLQKAEAQAREAQIEAALEKVRSASMAMHNSDELQKVIRVLTDQLTAINFTFDTANFIVNDSMPHWEMWVSSPGSGDLPPKIHVDYLNHPLFNERNEAFKKGDSFLTAVFDKPVKNEFLQYLFERTAAKYTPGERKKWILDQPGMGLTTILMKTISLSVINYKARLYTEQENEVIRRFAYVFEQSYTRFLDLQKAELQSREAQIELALERVRARTMAMQHSEELQDTSLVLFKQLKELGEPAEQCTIGIVRESEGVVEVSATLHGNTMHQTFRHRIDEAFVMSKIFKGWKDQQRTFVLELKDEELQNYNQYRNELVGAETFPVKLVPGDRRIIHVAYFSKGMLALSTNEPRPRESLQLLERFAKVFEQTYTRFLDLQKAEAQSREAQIELGLERVRARAMAMQRSDELKELIGTVSTELAKLDLVLDRCFIMIYDLPTMGMTWWMSNPEMPLEPLGLFIKYHNHPPFMAYRKGWEQQQLKWEYTLEGSDKENWDAFLFTETELSLLPPVVINNMKRLERVCLFASFNKFGCLSIAAQEPLSIDQTDILLRFAKVFELTYTRFNDLQKAELQAREAQIELGLERVRARAMAMQKSDELNELVGTLYTELTKLDFALVRCLIWVMDAATNSSRLWMANSETPSQPANFYVPFHENPPYIAFLNAWKEKNPKWQYDLQGNIKKDWDEFIFHQTEMQHLPEPVKKGMQASDRVLLSASFHNFGCLQTASTSPLTDEHFDILNRFAKVFDLTYTRFNDLQKAEAQAREAQVEASLERIRAKAMAMHHSGELDEVLETLFDQFDILGIHPVSTHMTLIDVATNTFTFRETGKGGRRSFGEQTVAIDSMDIWKEAADRWKTSDPLSLNILHFPKASLPVVWQVFHESFASMPDHAKIVPEDYPDGIYHTAGNCKFGYIGMNQTRKATPEEEQVVLKFAIEFGRLYQRFLDLQKAESQIREARIEAALEKVRSSSLAMHKSEDLKNVVKLVFDNFNALGLKNIDSVNINIFHEGSKDFDLWLAAPGQNYTRNFCLPYIDHPIAREFFTAKENGEEFHQKVYAHDVKNAYFEYMFEHSDNKHLPAERKKAVIEGPAYAVATGIGRHTSIFIHNYSGLPFSDEVNGILVRFTKVFDQSYRRFLDLQQAEAQAREAQIEASLERVRSKTMAMHNSQDVGATVMTMFDELVKLGVNKTIRCGIGVLKDTTELELWTAYWGEDNNVSMTLGRVDTSIHPLLSGAANAWKNKELSFSYELAGEDLVNYYTALNDAPAYPFHIDISILPERIIHYDFYFPDGTVFAFAREPLAGELIQIFKRFAAVFGQTYRRYLDLLKAEANAKEAQIQASLERVRSKAMAMHSSQDLADTIGLFYNELETFSITPRRCGVGLLSKETRIAELSTMNTTEEGKSIEVIGKIRLEGHPVLDGVYDNWLLQKEYYPVLRGNEIKEYYKLIKPQVAFPDYPNDTVQYGYFFYFPEGGVYAWTAKQLGEDEQKLYRRFTTVLSLTYKRYKDLKEAEAQAREAQVEASLERVRGKAMSMHSSKDLSDTVDIFFKELKVLGITPLRCGVGELDEAERTSTLSATTAHQQGDSYEVIGKLKLAGHPVLDNIFEHWKLQKEYFPVLKGSELTRYYQVMRPQISFPDYGETVEHYGNYFYFKEGLVFAWTEKALTEEELQIFRKFTSVVSLTYRRYIELQKSEANALEAVKQAALDRVRAEIASMRTTADLERITPVIWKELTILGIPFIRCGVFIMDEEQQQLHTFLSTPDGKAIGAFHLPYTTTGNIQLVLSNWREKRKYIDHWNKDSFTDFADILVKQGTIASPAQYLQGIPQGGFHLHFLPFLQGMLYVGNTNQLDKEELRLIQSVADAFSTAYARYEDFNKLEAAKQQVDKTLADLKLTQQQLVQSEKMASLGELTAGIAHEIQNPLNFVNNFSEVSNELIDEMMEEVAKGNYEEVKAIAEDVKQNLGKINHHGKRADGIVKGMLQHSRSSSATKEPTDISKLADEYLRLAYHGLRAKDKTFNATLKTDYDDSIGLISVFPQDIGRVILNLITNAFYVVTERKKKEGKEYEPIVSVTTRMAGGCVEISVKDNGSGIPAHVLDKIFQPFFTTKPTGQGTGLGLSLSYDIVKAHGGELKVKTKEGEGSEFIIQLPAV